MLITRPDGVDAQALIRQEAVVQQEGRGHGAPFQEGGAAQLWQLMRKEARLNADMVLIGLIRSCILDQRDLAGGLARLLSSKFAGEMVPAQVLNALIRDFSRSDRMLLKWRPQTCAQ